MSGLNPGSSEASDQCHVISRPRIQDTDIWDRIVETAMYGLSLTGRLKERYRYRFAEKLQQAVLGFYLNIADGSNATSQDQYQQALLVAKRSLLDTAHILTLLRERRLVSARMAGLMIPRLEELSLEIGRYQLAA